jgi:UDP-N-acetylglucosamine:LPS N-acetylglucosamine transferase
MKEMIESSDFIITRSGYTTLMELISLNRTALIIPTPGQTEQEYLADYLSERDGSARISREK